MRRFVVERATQRLIPPLERLARREQRLRRAILVVTGLVLVGCLGATPLGRFAVFSAAIRSKSFVVRAIGQEPDRGDLDRLWAWRRERGIADTAKRFEGVFGQCKPTLQELLRAAGMAPDQGLLRWANYDRTLLFSSCVFEPDSRGRSYRLRPETRSVWLKEKSLAGSPFGMLLVPDNPRVRMLAQAAGIPPIAGSEQSTNSWGLRGPEPDLEASVRGLILGDSFMQGLFIGDDQTPPARLERTLEGALHTSVSILNTGHFGYSPEQYYHTLVEYGPRFNPHFVVVSVCPNDFGDPQKVVLGQGDWAEAKYWLDEIQEYCNDRGIACIIAAVPCDFQLEGKRKEGYYPGQVANTCDLDSLTYCYPFDDFVNEHLRLVHESQVKGIPQSVSPLYNRRIGDGHFSPAGADVWAHALAQRVSLIIQNVPSGSVLASRSAVSTVPARE